MVLGLKKTGDVLARSDLCHLHDGARGGGVLRDRCGWSAGRCPRSSTAVCAGGLTPPPPGR